MKMAHIFFLVLWLGIVSQLSLASCASVPGKIPSPQTIVDTTSYSLALDECRAKGKDAGAYAIYEECAVKADIKYGRVIK